MASTDALNKVPPLRVTLVHSPAAAEVQETEVNLAPGARVADALYASGWLVQWPHLQGALVATRVGAGHVTVSIWGRQADGQTLLQDGDRVEFCRALRVDPKVARRERFKRQGARQTGLFARQRPGAKPGY